MNTTKKLLVTGTVAATALTGLMSVAPGANASTSATKTFSKSFLQTCAVGPFGTHKLGATVSGTVPTAVKRGAAFKLTNAKIKVQVGVAADGAPNLNAQAYAAGARFQKVTFSVVNINNVDIKPAVKDIVSTNITTVFVPVPNGGVTTFVAPKTGALAAALTAGGTKGAGAAKIKAGAVKATFTLYNADKQPILVNQTVGCGATNTLLTSINVT